jgi:peptidoglycan/LPS O-acetylase OafA/YrhL
MSRGALEYRKDIQILRGIAVTLVVFFHLGISGFSFGFLGVDIFFVVSGYLMALLYDPTDTWDFFSKRARRLLPAYFATVIAALIVAFVVVIPSDYAQVSIQANFAAFFASNIGFWMEASYFDKQTFKPLLHLWSLGVEIQFYLMVPLLSRVFGKSRVTYTLLLVGSALACFAVVGVSPKTAFFWLPFRLWEFLIGFGVAMYADRHKARDRVYVGLSALIALIFISQLSVDGTALGFLHGQPGVVALLICASTAIVLAFGIPQWMEDAFISRLLVKIGDYSYSIYLAHFIIITLFLYRPFSGTVLKAESGRQTLELLLLICGGAILLYHAVERAFHRNTSPRLIWGASGAAIVASIAFAQLGLAMQRTMIPPREMLIYQALDDRSDFRCGKVFRVLHPLARSCEISDHISKPTHRVMLVGDSHADAIKRTFTAAAEARNVAVYFMVQNESPKADGFTAQALIREAQSRHIDSVVVHYASAGVESTALNELAQLAQEHSIRMSFIMPVPEWRESIPEALWSHLKVGAALPVQDMNGYRLANAGLIDGLANADFRIYETAGVFCRSYCTFVSDNGKPLYFDGGHLTLTGSGLLRGVFDRVIADLDSRYRTNNGTQKESGPEISN